MTITAAQGGHAGPVQVLLPFRHFLLSADWLGAIKVWDMATGQCLQTMQQAHKEPIMGLLQWEVSCAAIAWCVLHSDRSRHCITPCDKRQSASYAGYAHSQSSERQPSLIYLLISLFDLLNVAGLGEHFFRQLGVPRPLPAGLVRRKDLHAWGC